MKNILLAFSSIFLLVNWSYGQCTAGDGCTSINPPSAGLLVVAAGDKVCFTGDVAMGILQMSGGTISMCDGAIFAGAIVQISGGTLNLYGSSAFVTVIDLTTGGSLTVNQDDCTDNGNYFPGGVGTVPPSSTPECASLPVLLTSFTAYQNESDQIMIDWTTASELNNHYFNIERSIDLENWELIDSIAGSGTSSNPIDYSTIDEYPIKGTNYYRLTQYDYNGDSETFHIVPVEFIPSLRTHYLYPNPATTELNISVNNTQGLELIEIYNTFGVLLYSTTDVEETIHTIDLSAMNRGLYVVNFHYEDELIREKFIKK